jgi:hypothetical protein
VNVGIKFNSDDTPSGDRFHSQSLGCSGSLRRASKASHLMRPSEDEQSEGHLTEHFIQWHCCIGDPEDDDR